MGCLSDTVNLAAGAADGQERLNAGMEEESAQKKSCRWESDESLRAQRPSAWTGESIVFGAWEFERVRTGVGEYKEMLG